MSKKPFNIAIDGPAGAGKSTIAKLAAARLGFIYVDTGAMYRAMALHILQLGIDPDDEAAVSAACEGARISIRHRDGAQQVILNGEDVTGRIRTEEVGKAASSTSRYRPVREKLQRLQQDLAAETDVVMDGRDIGTCVLPCADLKIFLTAGSGVRAMRRYRELKEKGVACNLEEIEQDIIERDYRDMHRENSPLMQAEDAVLVDSSEMSIEEVAETIITAARSHGSGDDPSEERAGDCSGGGPNEEQTGHRLGVS